MKKKNFHIFFWFVISPGMTKYKDRMAWFYLNIYHKNYLYTLLSITKLNLL